MGAAVFIVKQPWLPMGIYLMWQAEMFIDEEMFDSHYA